MTINQKLSKFLVISQISTKFMRHLTYNHPEVIQAIIKEVKTQNRKPEFDLYK